MPLLEFTPNFVIPDEKTFARELANGIPKKFGSTLLQKPLATFSITLHKPATILFSGHGHQDDDFDKKSYILRVYSIGNFSPEANEDFMKSFYDFLQQKFGDEIDGQIHLVDIQATHFGSKGLTVTQHLRLKK